MFNLKINTALFSKRILLGYWIVSSLAIVMYLYITAISSGENLQHLLHSQASFAIGFLIAMVTLGNFLILINEEKFDFSEHEAKGVLYVILIQQCCMLNILGAILVFLYFKSKKYTFDLSLKKVRPSIKGLIFIVLLISAFLLFVLLRLRLLV
ncbi:hypothetical protein [Streptococcus halotolerans]|uniref:hypothetical protein n=1 Tax=Streptococcus halotolerans TaxID=1814128 RepID=UPI0007893D4D|nr:hypothetical protein [Streptococcus halotolerans]